MLIAAAVYFVVVVPMQALDRRKHEAAAEELPPKPEEVRLLAQIRDLLEHARAPTPQL